MSLFDRDATFISALKKNPEQRTSKDLDVIFSRLHRFEALSTLREQSLRTLCAQVRYEWHDANDILYGKDDPCTCWFILLSGSIFIQGSMFLRNTSFGRQITGTKRRGSQCLVLEPSEMIAIDYPDTQLSLHGSVLHVQRMKNQSFESKSTLCSVQEVENSSEENSPKMSAVKHSVMQATNGKPEAMQRDFPSENTKEDENYSDDEDTVNQDYADHDDAQSDMEEDDQEDSISLHSSSSLVIKDLVIEVLKKDISDRNEDDHDVLLEFTRSLQAFSNMTERIRRELCKVMVFAHVEKAGTVLLKDNEPLDSWSVIINGHVQVSFPDSGEEAAVLYMGESFGVTPNKKPQFHKGSMSTVVADCQFVCIAQQDYCDVLFQGKENMENVIGEDGMVEMVKEKRVIDGGKKGHIVIRGTPSSLRMHLLEENSIDTTFAEDYLLTYRAFSNEPLEICKQLLDWLDEDGFQAKVTRIILLWVNNHFNDFERNHLMMDLLEKFEEKLQKCNKTGECRLFNIACSTKAKSRIITLSRTSNEEEMGFTVTGGTDGYPIYILKVLKDSKAEEKGLKRGDQLLNVNGQNFEKLNLEKANAILRKNTDLTLTVKTNLFAFKEMMTDLKNPHKKKDKKKTKHDAPFVSQISTMNPSKSSRIGPAENDAYDGKVKKEVPEDVIKVFRADQTYKFVFVNQDTTAEEAVRSACKEFSISQDCHTSYSLCRVMVQNETFVKQSKLPDKWSKLSEIPLSARYYLKNDLESEQLLPDENIPDVLKEANYSFLDLNCFEVALHLTLQDYELFKAVEQTDFIDDLFHLNEESLADFKSYENLVNRELFWVVSTICQEPNVIRRAKMIKHFTRIAHHCKALKNLNSTFAIISGLGYRAVSRMKCSWEKVPAKVQRTFDDLQSLMDPSRNMSKYRTLLNDLVAQPPVLPYVPVIKKDLTFLHLGNDTKVEGLVNFEKMRMIGREVRNVCKLCSADSSQIFATAASFGTEPDRPASSIYHTLTRRGRRSSFNNARRMYEDAVNARRVKQYMQQLQIETDEDKLMEMSKQVEPVPVSSAQTKRRIAPSDSPSKSTRTLPNTANGLKRAPHGRNLSEPQISVGPNVLAAAATRKKNPVSSLPKFGTSSPQAISKLLALSEESGEGSSGSSKRGSLEQRRSASSSSRELSPAASPYLSPKRDIARSKGSISSSDSGQSIAHENTNRNNNRARRQQDRPVALQGRSGSYGALSASTRQNPSNSTPNLLIGSTSSPSLIAKASSSQHHLMLLSHSEIPRSPSMDSGVVSMGSLSADSTRFLHSEPGEIFQGPAHRSLTSLASSEGFASQQSLQHVGARANIESPVMRRHLRNQQMRHDNAQKSNDSPTDVSEASGARKRSPESALLEDAEGDDIKQTFLSGSRGWGDAPLMRDKDPWPVEVVLPPERCGTLSPFGVVVRPIGETIAPSNQHLAPRNLAREPDMVDGSYHRYSPQRRMTTGADVEQYFEHLRYQERLRPPMSLQICPVPAQGSVDARTPEAVLNKFHHEELWHNKSFDAAASSGTYPVTQPLCERHSFTASSSGYQATPGSLQSPVGRKSAMPHHLNVSKSDPLVCYHDFSPSLSNHYPRYPHFENKTLSCRQVIDTPRSVHVLPNMNSSSDPRLCYQRHPHGSFIYDFLHNPDPKMAQSRQEVTRPNAGASIHPKLMDHQTEHFPLAFHCPKHGSPLIDSEVGYSSRHLQSLHSMPEFSSLPLPHSVDSTPDTPASRLRSKTHLESPPKQENEMHNYNYTRVMHSRSSSDISLRMSSYQSDDGVVNLNDSLGSLHVEDARMFASPSKDKCMEDRRIKPGFFEKQMGFSVENSSISSTLKSQYFAATVRRKSSEWAVTDLDKETQQQAMQVWTSGSASTIKPAAPVENSSDVINSIQSRSLISKRKKPPPPLPPQRNSSYCLSRQMRLSSSTLSPLSSPPNSPTTPVSHIKISLCETHPQLLVKTMPNGGSMQVESLAPADHLLQLKSLQQPNEAEGSRRSSSEQPSTRGRTLPSYTEAINHLSSDSPFLLPNSKLPTYQAHRELKDWKERASNV